MTEKLLSKPPFRYLHDIFTATLSKTGFGEGLFLGDELNSKSYEDKDSKLKFLAKLVTLTEMILGEKQDIKPSMVLAGQQADKTNLWLQNLFRASTAGVDTSPFVAQILGVGGDGGDGDGDGDVGDGGDEDDGETGDAEAQAAAEQQAKAEAHARAQHEAAAKDDKKRRMEDKKRRQQQVEEEERQRLQYESQEQERMMQEQME